VRIDAFDTEIRPSNWSELSESFRCTDLVKLAAAERIRTKKWYTGTSSLDRKTKLSARYIQVQF
jgi:hypothetical protein